MHKEEVVVVADDAVDVVIVAVVVVTGPLPAATPATSDASSGAGRSRLIFTNSCARSKTTCHYGITIKT